MVVHFSLDNIVNSWPGMKRSNTNDKQVWLWDEWEMSVYSVYTQSYTYQEPFSCVLLVHIIIIVFTMVYFLPITVDNSNAKTHL